MSTWPRTHCQRGHSLSGDNLYVSGGKRRCKACHKERERKYVRPTVAEMTPEQQERRRELGRERSDRYRAKPGIRARERVWQREYQRGYAMRPEVVVRRRENEKKRGPRPYGWGKWKQRAKAEITELQWREIGRLADAKKGDAAK